MSGQGFIKDEIPVIVEDSFLIKAEIDIKTEMLTNNDDSNETYTENITVNNDKSNYIPIDTLNTYLDIKSERGDNDRYTDTANSIVIVEDSFLVKEEIDIKKEMLTCLNNDGNNETYTENITVNNDKSNYIPIDTLNTYLDIKSERGDNDRYTDTANSIVIVEDSFLVKEEIDIKKEMLTCLNNDGNNETYTENITVNNDKSNNVQIDTLNAHLKIKTENYYENTNIQNSILVIEDGYSIKVENDNFPNTNSSLVCSTYEENTSFQNNEDNNTLHSRKQSIANCDKKQFKCDICQISFSRKGTLRKHMSTHTGNKTHKCNICQKAFSLKQYLKKHMITHSSKKPYKCNVCQKSYSQNYVLKKHMLTHTGKKPHKCNLCQKSFSLMQNFNIHLFTHNSQKPHKCNICHKAFSIKRYLKKHMVTHTDEKPYKCNVCQKSFSLKSNFNIHMSTHTSQKPHKCNICQKAFSLKPYLRKHMLTHTSEKLYKCKICQKSWSLKSNFKTHVSTHTSQKSYKCNICQKAFSLKQYLRKHMLTHTSEKPYKCKICPKSVTRKEHLKRHMLKNHNNVMSV